MKYKLNQKYNGRLVQTINQHIFLSLTYLVDSSRDVCEIFTSTESTKTTGEPSTTETAETEDRNGIHFTLLSIPSTCNE